MPDLQESRKDSVQVARAILHDRGSRRKMMMRVLLSLVGMVALGSWLIDGFLATSVLLFCVYWGALSIGVLFLILFCVYDLLKVMQDQ